MHKDVIVTQEYVRQSMRDAMKNVIGVGIPNDSGIQVIEAAAASMADEVVARAGRGAEPDRDRLRDLFRFTIWVHRTDQERYDPRKLLGEMSEGTIEFLKENVCSLGTVLTQLVSIEVARRTGNVLDWSWEWWEHGGGGNITARSNIPIKFVKVTLNLEGSSESK